MPVSASSYEFNPSRVSVTFEFVTGFVSTAPGGDEPSPTLQRTALDQARDLIALQAQNEGAQPDPQGSEIATNGVGILDIAEGYDAISSVIGAAAPAKFLKNLASALVAQGIPVIGLVRPASEAQPSLAMLEAALHAACIGYMNADLETVTSAVALDFVTAMCQSAGFPVPS